MEARLGLLALQSLFDAASKGDAALTKRLLKKGTPPNAMDPDGDTPLICAAQGRVILQDHLPDMSLRKSETLAAAELDCGAETGGHSECVRVLLDNGASATLANALGESPLHVASWDGHADTVSMLVAAGAPVNKPGPDGETPLLLAADGGHLEVQATFLLQRSCKLKTAC
ncbi:hypothetical protein MMC34_008469 [Xylographa carneopallida]|nr:hypothetical protein [Xylographa carneopallida]